MQASAPKAVDTLVAALDSPDTGVAVRAADLLLKRVVPEHVAAQVAVHVDATDVRKTFARLMERLAERTREEVSPSPISSRIRRS